jgi:hypothetical protein
MHVFNPESPPEATWERFKTKANSIILVIAAEEPTSGKNAPDHMVYA